MNIKTTNKLGLKGLYTVTISSVKTELQQKLLLEIEALRSHGLPFMSLVRELNSLCNGTVLQYENIVPTVARAMIANNICNSSPTNTMTVEYVALGTGSTAPANADTKLVTETYRNAVASKTNSDNVGYVSGFFSATECNGTYYEAALFCDASATTDSGILLSRVLLNSPTGITKSGTETLTVDWTLTIS